MIFPWDYSRRLREATDENDVLREKLRNAEATISHLRHMLELKTEECGQLAANIATLREKADYADRLEERVMELDAMADRFAPLKKSLDRKIEKLRMERDEARAMLAARDALPEKGRPIDFVDREALQLPNLPDAPAPTSPTRSDPSPDLPEWYIPIPD